jgi:hypothetical protein
VTAAVLLAGRGPLWRMAVAASVGGGVTAGTEIEAVLLFGMVPDVRIVGAVGPKIGIVLFLSGVVSVPGPAGGANRDLMPASGLGLAGVAGVADAAGVAGAGAALAGAGGAAGAGGILASAS